MSIKKGFYFFAVCFIVHIKTIAQTFPFAKLEGSPIDTAGWFLAGDAKIGDTPGDTNTENDELILVPPNNTRSGACFYKKPVNITSCQKWVAEFDFRIWQGTGADGLAFFFLNNPPASYITGGGMGIPPRPLGLMVCFDTWQNCSANTTGPVPKIQIRYGNGVRNYSECPSPAEPTITGIRSLRGPNYNHARIVYDFGSISVFLNDTLRLTGNYTINFAGYFGLTASTGGSTDLHSIRNFVLYTQKPLLLAPDAGVDRSVCNGTPTTIGTSQTSGNYSYNWYPTTGLSDSSISNPTINFQNDQSGIQTITYFVTKDTVNGGEPRCAFADEVKISFLPKLNQMPTNTVVCAKTPKTIGFGGISNATYSWSPPSLLSSTGIPNPSFFSTSLDSVDKTINYIVSATHPAGCVETDTVRVNHLGRFANAGSDVTICGNDTVDIGKSPRLDFNYSWFQISANSPKFNSVIENTQSGNTRVIVSNSDSLPVSILYRQIVLRQDYNCTNDDTVMVRIFPKPNPQMIPGASLCPYDTVLIGGINQSKYSYEWLNNGTSNSNTSIFGSPVFTARDSTFYRKRMWAALNECLTIDSFNVRYKPYPEIFRTGDKAICPGDSVVLGAGEVAVSGYSYNWSPAQNLNETNKQRATFYAGSIVNQNLSYVLTNTLEACKITDTVIVKVWNNPSFNAEPFFRVCSDRSQKIGPDSLAGYSYKWLDSSFLNSDSIANPVLYLSYPSGNENELKFAIRTTENLTGCQRVDTIRTILQTKPPANAGPDLSVCSGDTINIGVQNFLVDMAYSWTGSPGILNPQSNVSGFSLQSNSSVNQALIVKFSSSANGCTAFDTMQVRVKQLPEIFRTPDKLLCPKDSVVLGTTSISNPSYTYNWFPNQNLSESNKAQVTFYAKSIENEILSYILTNTLESCSVSDTVLIKIWNSPSFSSASPFKICSEIPGKIGPDSIPGYQYNWLNNENLSQSSIAKPLIFLRYQIENERDLKYAIQTKENLTGCARVDTVLVNLQKAPDVKAGLDIEVCSGDTILIGNQNPQSDLEFYWSGSAGIINPQNSKVKFTLISNSKKEESVILQVKSLINTCLAFDTVSILVKPLPFIPRPVGKVTLCASDSIFNYINPIGSLNKTSFSWEILGGKILDSNEVQAKVQWLAGRNSLSLLMLDSLGCRNKSEATIVESYPKPSGNFSISGSGFVCSGAFNEKQFELNGTFSSSIWLAKGGFVNSRNTTRSNINFNPEANKFQVLAIPISDKNCKGDTIIKEILFGEIKPEILSASVSETGTVEIISSGLSGSNEAKISFSSKSKNGDQAIENEPLTKIGDLPTKERINFTIKAKDQCQVERTSITHSIISGTVTARSLDNELEINTKWTPYTGNTTPIQYALFKYSEAIQDFEKIDTSSTFGLKINEFTPFEKPKFKVRSTWLDNGIERISWSDEFETILEIPKPLFPNLFTPNGDGINDTFFIPYLFWYPNSNLQFFDRWGKQVYKADSYQNDWLANGLDDGIYFFKFSNDRISEHGWVQVKR
jgi:gliding motility-associated-like protein